MHYSVVVPPPPKPTVTALSTDIIYAGSTATLKCSVALEHSSYQDKEVLVSWKRNGQTVNVTNNSRISVETAVAEENIHSSLLTVFPTSSFGDSGNYTCAVVVLNESISSEVILSDNLPLDIKSKHDHC